MAGTLAGQAALASTLQSLNYASLPGNKLEVRLGFDQSPPDVRSYSIEKPARIALDLVGATNGLEGRNHNLGTGNAPQRHGGGSERPDAADRQPGAN